MGRQNAGVTPWLPAPLHAGLFHACFVVDFERRSSWAPGLRRASDAVQRGDDHSAVGFLLGRELGVAGALEQTVAVTVGERVVEGIGILCIRKRIVPKLLALLAQNQVGCMGFVFSCNGHEFVPQNGSKE